MDDFGTRLRNITNVSRVDIGLAQKSKRMQEQEAKEQARIASEAAWERWIEMATPTIKTMLEEQARLGKDIFTIYGYEGLPPFLEGQLDQDPDDNRPDAGTVAKRLREAWASQGVQIDMSGRSKSETTNMGDSAAPCFTRIVSHELTFVWL